MIVLVLDDQRERHTILEHRLLADPHISVVHTYTATECCEILNAAVAPFDVAYLDHDLGERVFDPYPREVTGYDVACHIKAMPKATRPKRVIVHSVNSDGALRMISKLRDVYEWWEVQWIPFLSDEKEIRSLSKPEKQLK